MRATTQNATRVAKALNRAVNALLLAQLHAKVQREEIDPIYLAILREAPGYLDDNDEHITELRYSYRIADELEAKIYHDKCADAIEAKGYKVKRGYCPALIAESIVTEAEHVLVDCALPFFPGMTVHKVICSGLDNYQKYIKLLTGLVVSSPGFVAPVLRKP